jgi:hypothetical protein
LISLVSAKIAPAELIAPASKLLALKSAFARGSAIHVRPRREVAVRRYPMWRK